ncbi:phosphate uptake regulator PhoU [Candidatus Woesearchaeota archaeon]|nr:phosphate uptake regulator PhoU [Candidatus Woesearchaeota archaeon]
MVKRRVIQIANSTQLISLPRRWALQNSIAKGDELELTEQGSKLIVQAGRGEPVSQKIELDLTGMGGLIIKVVASLYKAGFDEMLLKFNKDEELKYIRDSIQGNCIGMEVVEQGAGFVTAKKVSDIIDTEFNSILRRTVLFVQSMGNESLQAIKLGDASALNSVIAMDMNVNKFSCFCRRLLNKHGHPDNKRPAPLYAVIEQIEEIGDMYKKVCQYYRDTKLKMHPNISRVYEDVNSFVHKLLDMMYKIDVHKLRDLNDERKRLVEALEKASATVEKKEIKVLFLLERVVDHAWGITGPMLSYVY